MAVVLGGVLFEQEQEKLEEILKRSAELSSVVAAIDDVVACYARSRGIR